jgi:hypothetical protein
MVAEGKHRHLQETLERLGLLEVAVVPMAVLAAIQDKELLVKETPAERGF